MTWAHAVWAAVGAVVGAAIRHVWRHRSIEVDVTVHDHRDHPGEP